MPYLTEGFSLVALMTVALILLVIFRPHLTVVRGGKILAFLAFFILPAAVTSLGVSVHMEHSKTTEFCLSCHVMEPYGHSLYIDAPDYIPADHYQNKRIPWEQACFTCHTTYTLFGDYKAKIRGMKHVWAYYLGEMPEKIELYEPYHNRECLHCHGGARSFEENELHVDIREELARNETSCLECHDLIHAIGELEQLPRWKGEGE